MTVDQENHFLQQVQSNLLVRCQVPSKSYLPWNQSIPLSCPYICGRMAIVEVGTTHPSGVHEFTPVFNGVRVTLDLSIMFCRSLFFFFTFSFGHCALCLLLVYGFWLHFWHRHTLHEVCLIRLKKQVDKKNRTVGTHVYADCSLRNTSTKYNTYIVNRKPSIWYVWQN